MAQAQQKQYFTHKGGSRLKHPHWSLLQLPCKQREHEQLDRPLAQPNVKTGSAWCLLLPATLSTLLLVSFFHSLLHFEATVHASSSSIIMPPFLLAGPRFCCAGTPSHRLDDPPRHFDVFSASDVTVRALMSRMLTKSTPTWRSSSLCLAFTAVHKEMPH